MRPVEFESLNERMFYYFLELDSQVVRYYVQPIRIPMIANNTEWFHIPDVLVFRQGSIPHLYQIKESPISNLEVKVQLCNKECEFVCEKNNWVYNVIHPKTLPEPLPRNISFLGGYLRTRKYYSDWIMKVINRLENIGPCTVNYISTSFIDEMDPLLIKPLLFHLITKGVFLVDVSQVIGSDVIITLNAEMNSMFSITGEAAINNPQRRDKNAY